MERAAAGALGSPADLPSVNTLRLAMLLQGAPVLGAVSVFADGVLNHVAVANPMAWYPLGDPYRWPLQVLSLSWLFAGSGYVLLRRWRRFICVWLMGAACFTGLQASLAAGATALEVWTAVAATVLAAVATGDTRLLATGRNVVGEMPRAAKVVVCILLSALALVVILAMSLVLLLTVACRIRFTNCI